MTPSELIRARKNAGMTRTALAAAIGKAERSIYRYEAGERDIDEETEQALRAVLEARKVAK